MVVQGLDLIARAFIPLAFVTYGVATGDALGTDDGLGTPTFIAAGVFLLVIAMSAVSTYLGWYRLRYRIGANDVRLEQGIISRSARSVPYDRIQDVSLEQKLLPRLLGLVEVKFETGAGGKEELKLTYVKEAEGEALRETVRSLVEDADEAATTGPEAENAVPSAPAADARLLFAMNEKRLFTYGLFSFSLVIFTVILGAAQQFEFLLPFDLGDLIESFVEDERYADAGGYIAGLDTTSRIVGILWLIVSIIGVGLLSGLVKTFLRDYDFRLERTAKGFRRRRGLLTKTDVVMPVHRVQALIVSTGWLRRRFGWHGLSVISLAQDSGSANHDVAPFAKMHEIAPIAGEAGFALPDDSEEWRRPSPKYYVDSAIINAITFIVLAAIGVTVALAMENLRGSVLALIVALVALLTAFFALREFYLWRYDRHALDPDQVLSRRGWLAPRTQIANRVKLHTVEIAQGPIARWRGYCDLKFGMAGGSFAFEGLRVEDARKLRAAVLDSIASVDFAKLAR
ncbi:hypothetical protein D6201_09960 [Aurantiacibacter aquimixticola]|uniref:YdbS-like PH domain-containing protein n=2 Tax=Aurantiacibacter aquimixticola TaxID=1958945 RepID=A0A419RX38_9SPHN|nr:hypothetical protein D6201_09960 [Aurantiacibacter aquimixticola]